MLGGVPRGLPPPNKHVQLLREDLRELEQMRDRESKFTKELELVLASGGSVEAA